MRNGEGRVRGAPSLYLPSLCTVCSRAPVGLLAGLSKDLLLKLAIYKSRYQSINLGEGVFFCRSPFRRWGRGGGWECAWSALLTLASE